MCASMLSVKYLWFVFIYPHDGYRLQRSWFVIAQRVVLFHATVTLCAESNDDIGSLLFTFILPQNLFRIYFIILTVQSHLSLNLTFTCSDGSSGSTVSTCLACSLPQKSRSYHAYDGDIQCNRSCNSCSVVITLH